MVDPTDLNLEDSFDGKTFLELGGGRSIYAWASFLSLTIIGSLAITGLIFLADVHFGWER